MNTWDCVLQFGGMYGFLLIFLSGIFWITDGFALHSFIGFCVGVLFIILGLFSKAKQKIDELKD